MTTGVVLVTHGEAGAAMLAAVEEKFGAPLPGVVAVAVQVGESATDVLRQVEGAVRALGVEEVVFLVDLSGSTPFNVCCRSYLGRSVVVSGVNLPMLFKLATADRGAGARRLAEELVATGTKSIGLREGE